MSPGSRSAAVVCALAAGVLGTGGCATRPAGRWVVDRVEIEGGKQVDTGEVVDHLATHASSTVLGIPHGAPLSLPLDYEVYDPFVVGRDVQRIERYYHARGYYGVRVEAARVVRLAEMRVRVVFVVDEGEATHVGQVRVEPRGPLAPGAAAALSQAGQAPQPGTRFDEDAYADLKHRVARALTDNGHAHAQVEGGFSESDLTPDGGSPTLLDPRRDIARIEELERQDTEARPDDERQPIGPGEGDKKKRYGVRVDAVYRTADLFLLVDPGPICTFGEVRLQGAEGLPESRLRATIAIKAGGLYSTTELDESRRALLALGLFSSVEYVADLAPERGIVVPVTFKLTKSPLHDLTIGPGVQFDTLQSDVHLIAGYEQNNFLGGLRRLSLQARPGVVLFPTNLQNFILPPERLLPQLRTRAELRQPGFIEARTNGTLRTDFLVYPYLVPVSSRAAVPDVVIGYIEVHPSVGIDRSFFGDHLKLGAAQHLQLSYPFSYFGLSDLKDTYGLDKVVIPYVSLLQAVDFRDDPLNPRRGFYFLNEAQFAGGPGSSAADIRVQPDMRVYAPLSKKLTLAARGSVGFLFPSNYGQTLREEGPDPKSQNYASLAQQFTKDRDRDLQILYFRAFFSGGPNSNRGYPIRGVGPYGIAPFNLGGGATTQIADCVVRVNHGTGVAGTASGLAAVPAVDPQRCGVPLGGLSLWESSLEVRTQVSEKFSTSVFLDGSDVTRQQVQINFTSPHLSTGVGLRYETPVGPFRFDIGYAIPGLQLSKSRDPTTEGPPGKTLGIPIALNLAVGQPF